MVADILKGNKLPPIPDILDFRLEIQVFRHGSAPGAEEYGDYDRLEFLGDAYLEVAASKLIARRLPFLKAGKMSNLREHLVRNETLAVFSDAYKLIDQLVYDASTYIGQKIYADVFEAYAAAVVESDPRNGTKRLEDWMHALWEPMLPSAEVLHSATLEHQKRALTQGGKQITNAFKGTGVLFVASDAKQTLASHLSGRGDIKLTYTPQPLLEGDAKAFPQGQRHQVKRFVVTLTWPFEDTVVIGSGVGVGQKEATNVAANNALGEMVKEGTAAYGFRQRKVAADKERKIKQEEERKAALRAEDDDDDDGGAAEVKSGDESTA